jgi:hypothetical protein
VVLVAFDKAGNAASGPVTIIALPPEDPVIIQEPDDKIEIKRGESVLLNWTATDDYPDYYVISVNGTAVDTGPWYSGETVTYEFIGDEAGTYVIEIAFYDEGGHVSTSQVTVVVKPKPPSGALPPIILTGGGIALVIVAILIFLIIRRGRVRGED